MTTKTNNQIFNTGGHTRETAYLGYLDDGFSRYAKGFKQAAETLSDCVTESKLVADLYIYPLCYLYRHYLELKMKEILLVLHRVPGNSQPATKVNAKKSKLPFPDHHKLLLLWDEVKKRWCDKFDDSFPGWDIVEEAVREFSLVDSSGEGFRYPVDKLFQQTLGGVDRIEIQNLRAKMNEVSDILDRTEMVISDRWNYIRNEMESEI